MRVITYLGFTILSIFIQFCVMDFIQEKINASGKLSITNQSQKDTLHDVLKNISRKPHALYYRTNRALSKTSFSDALSQIYDNSTMLVALETTTDSSTTILDIMYEENGTETSTTDIIFTTTEFDNVTEITFFEKNNKSIHKNNIPLKPPSSKYCGCNLLYKVCDINCCCDPDCSSSELQIFECDETGILTEAKYNDGCISYLGHSDFGDLNMLDSLFCVVKTNLPSKRRITKYNEAKNIQYYQWRNLDQPRTIYEFKKTLYKQGDPVWLLKNGSIYYLDFPFPILNNYCNDRKAIIFLKSEKTRCNVVLKDLEMFHINSSESAVVISATENTMNTSVVNCSSVHCVNLTILACQSGTCQNYSNDAHEASCTETSCSNLALQVDYEFHYYNSRIENATLKLYLQNITNTGLMTQEININFIMANKSIEQVVELSGNPGYIRKRPVIVSYFNRNYTEDFYNNSLRSKLLYPENKHGLCALTNTSSNIVKFGLNKRTHCRYIHPRVSVTKLNSNLCKSVQDRVSELLGLNRNISISPYGNPYNISDEDWISLNIEKDKENIVYGKYNGNLSKLYCYNFINQVTVVFVVASVDEKSYVGQNKILSAKYVTTPKNISFNVEDMTTVISVDIIFVDITKPSLTEYATSPHLNIHLPKDFFFPFPSNSCCNIPNAIVLTIYCCVILLF